MSARDDEIEDYRRGLKNGNLKSATPCVVGLLIARIDELKYELAHLHRKVAHGCANFICNECDSNPGENP